MGEVQIGIVDGGNAIGGGQEAGDLGIGLVARSHILSTHALDGLAGATGLTDLLTGGQQHAHLGVRGHHGGDIAALGHDAQTPGEGVGRRFAGDVGALGGDEHVAHRDDVRHLGDMAGDFGGTNGLGDVLVVGEYAGVVRVHGDIEMVAGEELAHRFGDDTLIHGFGVQIDALLQAPPSAGTIHRARVKVGVSEILGQRLGRGRLAHAGGAVDGNANHRPTSLDSERTSVWDSTR